MTVERGLNLEQQYMKYLSIIALVNQIHTGKQKDSSADISALEKQIDEMVYALYGLYLYDFMRPLI